MKFAVVLAVLSLVAVAVHCHICSNNDPSACTHTCPDGESKACEHDVCACAKTCSQVVDCEDCPSHTDPMGHTVQETKHCVDGACTCTPEHMHPGGDHGHHGPGGR